MIYLDNEYKQYCTKISVQEVCPIGKVKRIVNVNASFANII
jgi:hypothetical protein